MDNQDKKRQAIIDAAIKRFAHFGLAKTTMAEIASDLSLSKALLYYYFPDKISLYAAILEIIISEFEKELSAGLGRFSDPKKALFFLLDKRQEFVQKYYNMLDYIRAAGHDLPESISLILENARNKEISLMASAIQKGIDNKQFKIKDANEAASLLMDAFIGMRYLVFSNKQQFQISSENFDILLDRQKKLGAIFIKGLS